MRSASSLRLICASLLTVPLGLLGCSGDESPPSAALGIQAAPLQANAAPIDAGTLAAPIAPPTPPTVPPGYIFAPFGWVHPSCIHEVPNGAKVYNDTVSLNGQVLAHYDPCPYAPVLSFANPTASGSSAQNGVRGPAAFVGWVEDTTQTAPAFTNPWWDQISATMIVPPAPTQATPETLYYFPGLISTISPQPANGCGILQPVLQWGGSPAGGGSYWTIGSWFWSVGGINNGYHTPLSTVSVGNSIAGTLTMVDPLPTSYWYIDAYDTSTHVGQAMYAYTSTCQYNVAYPATFETANGGLSDCNQVPYNYVNFLNITLDIPAGSWNSYYQWPYSPTNENRIGSNPPSCGWAIGNSGSQTTLWQ
jgi:hypothetical protein